MPNGVFRDAVIADHIVTIAVAVGWHDTGEGLAPELVHTYEVRDADGVLLETRSVGLPCPDEVTAAVLAAVADHETAVAVEIGASVSRIGE